MSRNDDYSLPHCVTEALAQGYSLPQRRSLHEAVSVAHSFTDLWQPIISRTNTQTTVAKLLVAPECVNIRLCFVVTRTNNIKET